MATSTPPMLAQDGSETGGAPVTVQPSPAEPLSFGENNRELPDEMKEALTGLIEQFQKREMYNRNVEGLNDRKMRFYDDGIQHFYANIGQGSYQIAEAGGTYNTGSGEVECSEYLGAFNIFRARRRTIDAPLTQNPPGIVFEPVHPDRSEDIEAAETAEGYRHLFDQMNDIQGIQQKITRYFELSGRVVARTFTTANQQKWGVNDQGKPRQMETTRIYGTLESKVPIMCRDQDAAIYCFCYEDPDILTARSNYPWLKEDGGGWKITGGEGSPGESDWTRYMRLGVMQSAKGAYVINLMVNHVVTKMHAYIRPEAFTDDKFDAVYSGPSGWDGEDYIREVSTNDDGSPMTLGDMFRKCFPEGIYAVYVGKVYAESYPQSMDDCIDIVMSEERDSMTGGALMEPMAIVQDCFNDFKNAEREFYEKGWPVTWFKGDQQDYDAFVDQGSKPAQFALLKNPVGGPEIPVSNQFYKEPEMEAPESFVEAMEEYRTVLSQDITGASPALQGVAGPHDQTATERQMDKAQSMGILGPTWSRVQMLFAGIRKKSALAAAKNPDHAKEIVVAVGDKQTTTIQLQKLSRGSFHCKPDDSAFPESIAAKRQALQAMLPTMGNSPVAAEFFASPDNWEEILKLNGFPELMLTPALAYRKQTRELEILLREAPVPNQPAVDAYNVQHAQQVLVAMQQGLPAPPYAPPAELLPSIMPRKRDYHKWELAKLQEYLSTEECYRQELMGNQAGIQNVELHADQHELMLNQQMMAAASMQQATAVPKEAINFKDESPAGQAAMNKQAGIDAGPPPASKPSPQKQGAADAR